MIDGITGLGLSDQDRWLVLETCGIGMVIPRFTEAGMMDINISGASGATISWGHDAITAAGGYYQLCWCGGPQVEEPCSTADDFLTNAGRLAMIGPSPLG
jgi:hypothetical protein